MVANCFLEVSEDGVQLRHVMCCQRLSDKLHNSIFRAALHAWSFSEIIRSVRYPTFRMAYARNTLVKRLPQNGLIKCGQLHQVVLRNRFDRFPGLAPGGQSTDNYERVESFFPQQMRHPGAGRFARSSTVKINVLVLGKVLDFLLQVVRLDAN